MNEADFLTTVPTDYDFRCKIAKLSGRQEVLYLNMELVWKINVDIRSSADQLPIKEFPKTAMQAFELCEYPLLSQAGLRGSVVRRGLLALCQEIAALYAVVSAIGSRTTSAPRNDSSANSRFA